MTAALVTTAHYNLTKNATAASGAAAESAEGSLSGVPRWVLGVAIGVTCAAFLAYIIFGSSPDPSKDPVQKKKQKTTSTQVTPPPTPTYVFEEKKAKEEIVSKEIEKEKVKIDDTPPTPTYVFEEKKSKEEIVSKENEKEKVKVDDIPEGPEDSIEKEEVAKNKGIEDGLEDSKRRSKGFSDECSSDSDSDMNEPRNLNYSGDFYNYFRTNYRISSSNSMTPLVKAVNSGKFDFVKSILDGLPPSGPKQVSTVNRASKWDTSGIHESESWSTWFGDTALIAAARLGNLEMVRILLLARADPTLECCQLEMSKYNENTYVFGYDTPLTAAEKMKKNNERLLESIENGCFFRTSFDYRKRVVSDSSINIDAGKIVEGVMINISRLTKVIEVLELANGFWDKTSYSSARYTKYRKKAFSKNPNQPKDTDALMKALDNFDFSEQEICKENLSTLTKRYSAIQKKKKENIISKYPRTNNSCQGGNCFNFPSPFCRYCYRCCPGDCLIFDHGFQDETVVF